VAFIVTIFGMGMNVGLHFFDKGGAATIAPGLPPGLVAAQSQSQQRLRRQQADEPETEGAVIDEPKQVVQKVVEEKDVATQVITAIPESYASFTGVESLSVSSSLDSEDVSAGAWIFVDSSKSISDMQTIISNRPGGCAGETANAGYTFHVNNWATRDLALVLEWRDDTASKDRETSYTGCSRLSTASGIVPENQWVHVAFSLRGVKDDATKGVRESKAFLFVNGNIVATGEGRKGGESSVHTTPRIASIGSTTDARFPFFGKIASVFVSRGVMTKKQLQSAYGLTDLSGLVDFAKLAREKLLALIVLGQKELNQPLVDSSGPVSKAIESGELPGVSLQETFSGSPHILVAELTGKARPEKTNEFSPAKEKEIRDRLAERLAKRATSASKHADSDAVPDKLARISVPGNPTSGAFDYTKGGNQWVRRMMRMSLADASGSVTDPVSLAAGTFSDEVTQEELEKSDRLGRDRALSVKGAMQHAWGFYRKNAWGMDELKPRSGTGDNNWLGLGMTLVDSLDTLWIMGMLDEFNEAKDWVAQNLDFNKQGSTSVFEITIRVLGGLLAAFDLSGEKVFLQKALELADRLLPAFNTPTGIPRASVSLGSGYASNPSWTGGSAILSEIGTLQLEFRHLSKASGAPQYGQKVEAVIAKLDEINPVNGLYPIYISTDSGQPTTGTITFGALGDSFYEYLIKMHVQGGLEETRYRKMYDEAMEGMTGQLLKHSVPSGLAYVADWNGGGTDDKMDHLVCFVPGMLALGAFNSAGQYGELNAKRDLQNAKALAYTCWQMYERQQTGISPEYVEFPGGQDLVVPSRAPFYILRPEAAESLFVLHQLTGNPIYREWGWKMFQAIEKYCKTTYGYGAHPDVRDTGRVPDDRMESFFLAETLKYLYMLQSPDHDISLERYVLGTEAHPLSRFDSNRWAELLVDKK
jgi:mannosyl-oligosaccharide alpha-1,2-mannosidase